MGIGIAEIDLIKQKRIRVKSGFTLIEVLLVLALVGLMAGLVAGNAGAFIAGSNIEPPDRVLKKSVLDAVYFAAERKRATYLYYSEQNATFVVTDASGVSLAEHQIFQKLPEENEQEIPEISFHAVGPLSGTDGGPTKYNDRIMELNRITFHSGCSVPFWAKIDFREKEEKIFFDPFSGYALKNLEE